jgi:hypothetical protein
MVESKEFNKKTDKTADKEEKEVDQKGDVVEVSEKVKVITSFD